MSLEQLPYELLLNISQHFKFTCELLTDLLRVRLISNGFNDAILDTLPMDNVLQDYADRTNSGNDWWQSQVQHGKQTSMCYYNGFSRQNRIPRHLLEVILSLPSKDFQALRRDPKASKYFSRLKEASKVLDMTLTGPRFSHLKPTTQTREHLVCNIKPPPNSTLASVLISQAAILYDGLRQSRLSWQRVKSVYWARGNSATDRPPPCWHITLAYEAVERADRAADIEPRLWLLFAAICADNMQLLEHFWFTGAYSAKRFDFLLSAAAVSKSYETLAFLVRNRLRVVGVHIIMHQAIRAAIVAGCKRSLRILLEPPGLSSPSVSIRRALTGCSQYSTQELKLRRHMCATCFAEMRGVLEGEYDLNGASLEVLRKCAEDFGNEMVLACVRG